MGQKRRIYCKFCDFFCYSPDDYVSHIEKHHSEMIPPDMTPWQFTHYLRTGTAHGSCIVCKKDTSWNDVTHRYERLCNNPVCKEKYKELFKNRMIGKYGKTHLLNDPEQQKKMLANRKISGKYIWSDRVHFFSYTGSYEKEFLEFLDHMMNFDPNDIIAPSPHTYYYEYNGEKHFYIPDFFIPSLDLEIEIKDGGSNANTHPDIVAVNKVKEKLKDEVMMKNHFNYLKICDKQHMKFLQYLEKAKENFIDKTDKPIYMIEKEITLEDLNELYTESPLVDNTKFDKCISYAMGVNDSIYKLKSKGFEIIEDDGDYKVIFDYKNHSIWESFINSNIENEYWNEYIRLSTGTIYFTIKDDNKITHVVNHNMKNDTKLLSTCNRLCEGNFKTIKDLIFSSDFYKSELTKNDNVVTESSNVNTDDIYSIDFPSPKSIELLNTDKECSRYLDTLKKDCVGEVLVNKEDDTLVGYAFVYNKKHKDHGFIFNVFLYKKYRGRGLGQKLVTDVINKYDGVDLTVKKDNKHAIDLYKKNNFVIIGDGNNKNEYYMKLRSKLTKDDEIVEEAVSDLKSAESNDVYHNLDLWESGECNLMWVTGISGSGKSTISKEISNKDKAEHIELDDLQRAKLHNWDSIGNDLLDGYIRSKGGLKNIFSYANEIENISFRELVCHEDCAKQFNDLFNFIMKYANSHKTTKYVVEGMQVAVYAQNNIIEKISEYPVVIKMNSPLKSEFRRESRLIKNRKQDGHSFSDIFKLVSKRLSNLIKEKSTKEDFNKVKNFKSLIGESTEDIITEACKDVRSARELASEVKKLAKKYDANFYFVTDGASTTNNNGNPAVKVARDAVAEWERKNGFDDIENWGNNPDDMSKYHLAKYTKSDVTKIIDKIHNKTVKDKKEPTGNQNCMLCTWCLEAQLRGIDILPRPVYSPSDKIFSLDPIDIFNKPTRQKFDSIAKVKSIVKSTGDNSRYYCHVNWKDSEGGHEFLVLNLNDEVYISDGQAGVLSSIDSKAGKEYFDDINYSNSFIARVDNVILNKEYLRYNDNKYILKWNDERDSKLVGESVDDEVEPIAESVIFNHDNFEINMDKWKPGCPLWITGSSGDGKSTLSNKIANEKNAYLVHLDLFLVRIARSREKWNHFLNDSSGTVMSEGAEMILDYINHHPELPWYEGSGWGSESNSPVLWNNLFDWLIDNAKNNPKYKNKLIIFEGCNICLMPPEKAVKLPIVIMGTSLLTGSFRRMKRDLGEHNEMPLLTAIKREFKRLSGTTGELNKAKMQFEKNLNKALKESVNDEYTTEASLVFNKSDLCKDIDKFESGKSNVLLVTGFSGSGKSTLAQELASKYNAKHIELDVLDMYNQDIDIEDLEKNEPALYAFIKSHKKEDLTYSKYIPFVINWCKKQKDQKFIIEGLQLYDTFDEKNPQSYYNNPIIIKGTSALISTLRAYKRNNEYNKDHKGSLQLDGFKNLLKWVLKDIKSVKKLEQYVRN